MLHKWLRCFDLLNGVIHMATDKQVLTRVKFDIQLNMYVNGEKKKLCNLFCTAVKIEAYQR